MNYVQFTHHASITGWSKNTTKFGMVAEQDFNKQHMEEK